MGYSGLPHTPRLEQTTIQAASVLEECFMFPIIIACVYLKIVLVKIRTRAAAAAFRVSKGNTSFSVPRLVQSYLFFFVIYCIVHHIKPEIEAPNF